MHHTLSLLPQSSPITTAHHPKVPFSHSLCTFRMCAAECNFRCCDVHFNRKNFGFLFFEKKQEEEEQTASHFAYDVDSGISAWEITIFAIVSHGIVPPVRRSYVNVCPAVPYRIQSSCLPGSIHRPKLFEQTWRCNHSCSNCSFSLFLFRSGEKLKPNLVMLCHHVRYWLIFHKTFRTICFFYPSSLFVHRLIR